MSSPDKFSKSLTKVEKILESIFEESNELMERGGKNQNRKGKKQRTGRPVAGSPSPSSSTTAPPGDETKSDSQEAPPEESKSEVDALSKIIDKLGLKDVSKSKLGVAIKAGKNRKPEHNKIIADFFTSMMDSEEQEFGSVIPLLKKVVAETPEESEATQETGNNVTQPSEDKPQKRLSDDHKKSITSIMSTLKVDKKEFKELLKNAGVIEESHIRQIVREKLLTSFHKK